MRAREQRVEQGATLAEQLAAGVNGGAKAEEIRELPSVTLQPAPWNARKTYDAAGIAELADSIREHGILQAIVVRVLADGAAEIVCGHRRYKAAVHAGLHVVPCVIRRLTDEQAREAGLVENIQRENLSLLDEVDGLAELMRAPGATIDTVAAKVGKGKTYVGRRLKLVDAIEPVREALRAGAIEAGHAMELCRLSPVQQARHLGGLRVGYEAPEKGGSIVEAQLNKVSPKIEWGQTAASVAELKAEIAHGELRVLGSAPFPLDAALAPMPCTECPKRSSNAGLLFEDLGQDTCTDRACFDRKVQAWIAQELKAAREEKRVLLKLSHGSTVGEGVLIDWDVKVLEVNSCGHADEAIWLNGENAGKRTWVCQGKGCRTHGRDSGQQTAGSRQQKSPAEKEKRSKLLAQVNAERAYRKALFEAVAQKKLSPKDLRIGQLVALVEYAIGRANGQYEEKTAEALGWPEHTLRYDGKAKLRAELTKLNQVELIRAALLASEANELGVSEYDVNRKPEGLERLAKLFGIDAKAVRASVQRPASGVQGKPTHSKIAKAVKEHVLNGAAKRKPLVFSKEARKRIAAAQKKRWSALRKAQKGGAK